MLARARRFVPAICIAPLAFMAGCGGHSATPTAPVPTPTSPPYVPGKLGITVLPATGPRTLSRNTPAINLHLVVRGLHLDAPAMGRSPVRAHGHLQVYLDRIPADAYSTVDLTGVVANIATPLFSVGFSPVVLTKKAGNHRLLIAAARNNYVLYRAKPAVVRVVFK